MTIAYFDCFAGISGDMTLGALLDCGVDSSALDAVVEALRLRDEVSIEVRHETRGHVGGTRVVLHMSGRVERTVPALREVIEDSDSSDAVKRPALDAVNRIARAEARIHGVTEDKVHLHELGGADALVDIVGAFWLLHELDVQRVYASPLPAPLGRHDGMPLPAPASLRILEGTGAVLQASDEAHELVTPTGAAILAASATFERPAMSLLRTGYGIGGRDTPGNALAVWIGEEAQRESDVTVVETNLDDMAPNAIAALLEDLMEQGALDASVTPIVMKKGRPGHRLTVLAPPALAAQVTDHLLRHSTTLGVRLSPVQRVIAVRRVIEVQSPFGRARVKVKELGGRPIDVAPEFEDCRRISRATGVDLSEVMRAVANAARRELGLDN